MNKTQKKDKKKSPKKLGMGLSSLLSSDEGLASVVKAKIESKVKSSSNNKDKNKPFLSLNVIKSNLDKKLENLESKENEQVKLPIQNLISGKFQPRKHFDQTELDELAESIRSNGILQPILVRPLNEKGSSYEIIAGERRWRAAQIVKLHEVPVIIRDFDDSTALGVALIENLQRSDLNIIEEAEGFRSLMLKFEYTQEKLSSQLGKSRSHIANVLRLLSLPNSVKRHISNGDLSFGHARVLVSLPEDKAKEVTDRIIDEELSVRKTEKLVNHIKRNKAVSSDGKIYDSFDKSNNINIEYLERELTVLLGLKVEFNHKNNNSGSMSIRYKTLDQIQPVIDKLKWKPK
ncbi:MAG: chromosome partitioning protein ParB [Rickettsiales bacterium]|nr:chromosome partitioning protein ParB [Rickettsiales bacterium]